MPRLPGWANFVAGAFFWHFDPHPSLRVILGSHGMTRQSASIFHLYRRPGSTLTKQQPELVCSCWTSCGDVAPLQAHEVSTFGIADRVTAISRAGWNGLGIGQDDLALIDHTMGFPRLRQIIADAGLKYTHLEVMTGWWSEEGESDQARSREELLLRAANDLGAQHIKATAALEQRRASLDYLASAIEPLIIRASDAGVNIALEPLPFSQVPTLATGAQMVEALGRANLGWLSILGRYLTELSHFRRLRQRFKIVGYLRSS